jgi:hypothetical protein
VRGTTISSVPPAFEAALSIGFPVYGPLKSGHSSFDVFQPPHGFVKLMNLYLGKEIVQETDLSWRAKLTDHLECLVELLASVPKGVQIGDDIANKLAVGPWQYAVESREQPADKAHTPSLEFGIPFRHGVGEEHANAPVLCSSSFKLGDLLP